MKRVSESRIRAVPDREGEQAAPDSRQQQVSSFKQHVSPIKQIVEEDAINEMSMQLVSPAESKQSFPQRALYAGSISPSTPNN